MEHFTWRVNPKSLLDDTEAARIAKASEILGLKTGFAIDSYKMSEDGPHLSSIFIVSDEFLSEIHLDVPGFVFDFSPITLLNNVRVTQGSAAIPATQPSSETDDAASVSPAGQEMPTKQVEHVSVILAHDPPLMSQLNYFGDGGDKWLEFLISNYALKAMRGSR